MSGACLRGLNSSTSVVSHTAASLGGVPVGGRHTAGVDVSQLTVAPGAGVSAFGRVVSAAGAVWFEPPLAVRAIGYLPGREPAPRPSGLGVVVRGVDLAALLELREKDGALEGWAAITGVWQDDELTVTAQSTLRPPPTPDPPSWTVPPCQPPAGGWPSGSDVPTGFDDALAALRASGGAVHITMFSPAGRGQVPVACASDPSWPKAGCARCAGSGCA